MAVMLLDDRCFQGQPSAVIRDMVDLVLEGPGLILAEDGLLDSAGTQLRFAEGAGRAEAVAHLQDRLVGERVGCAEREAIVACLARHAVPDDDLATWWWQHFSPDRDWLVAAMRFGCADPVPPVHRTDFGAAVRAVQDCGSVSEVIASFAEEQREVVDAIVADLNVGVGEWVSSGEGGLLDRLVAASRGSLPKQRPAKRRRTRRVDGQVRDRLALIEVAARAVSGLGPDTPSAKWASALASLSDAWGTDGWVIRDFVARLPERLEFDVLVECFEDSKPELAGLLQVESQRRAAIGDPNYWLAQVPSEPGIGAVDWLVYILTRAHTTTIIQLKDDLESVTQRLTSTELALAQAAIRRRGRRAALVLHDEIRLGRFGASLPLLLLLRAAAQEPALEQIEKRISAAINTASASTFVDASPLVPLLPGKAPIDWFRDGRRSLRKTISPVDVRIVGLTQARAKDILADPASWPTFIVHKAAQVLAPAIDKQPSLASVAERKGWFVPS